jgi:hypothetical protein
MDVGMALRAIWPSSSRLRPITSVCIKRNFIATAPRRLQECGKTHESVNCTVDGLSDEIHTIIKPSQTAFMFKHIALLFQSKGSMTALIATPFSTA